uniref:4-hydroxybenzoate polyprenyltransferase n=1 Tax=Plectus sambesii TaxID=2011161 RepID=A0A914V877_9BILA
MLRLCRACSSRLVLQPTPPISPASFYRGTSSFLHLKLFQPTTSRRRSVFQPASPYDSQCRSAYTISAQKLVSAAPLKWQPYLRLMRADKPIGTWLLYWPCTWSIAMASPPGVLPDPYLLALFGVGAFLMRGAGCIVNDLWDKDFDRMVERTKSRPLASGELRTRQAVALLAGVLSGSLAVLLQLNWCSVAVGAASLGLVATYPLAKRYTYWPQFVLGLTFNWGCILGWTAVHGDLSSWAVPAALYFGAINWTLIYD